MALSIRTFTTLGLLWVASASADTKVVPLSEARAKLVLPNYTAEERETLAAQADFMIRNLYVHREVKVKDFGAEADPLPKLEKLKAKAAELSNQELHAGLSKVFLDLHDLHTNYLAPAPLACGAAFFPLRLESVKENGKDLIVVARKASLKAELVKDFEIGDRILEIDGEDVEDVLSRTAKTSGGSNADAMRLRGVQLLTLRSLRQQTAPAKDTVKLKVERGDKTFEKEIAWQALLDEECLGATNKPRLPSFFADQMYLAVDEYQKKYNKVFGVPSLVDSEDTWANAAANPLSEIFEFAVLNTPAGKMGYVRLKAFYWTDCRLDIGTVVEGFRRAVESSLADTVGLIVDVRGNPGGHIVLSEKLVQLFSPKEVQPSTVRMLANDLNEQIFVRANGRDNRWSRAIQDAKQAGSKYIKPLAITPTSEANSIGQVWFRPVVLLTDASCYSACDMFTAGMQDSGAAVVIGLHKTTGGGGANVMEYNTFRSIMGLFDNPFKALPRGQNMRVSWRQTIRSGKFAGTLIENKGVESDVVVALQKSDLTSESKDLMDQIHRIVDNLRPKHVSGVGSRRAGLVVLNNGNAAKWNEKLHGVDAVEVFVDGKKVTTVDVERSEIPQDVEIRVDGLTGSWRDQRVTLQGKRDGRQVFRVVREVLWRGDYVEIPTDGIKIEFEDQDILPLRAVLLKGNLGTGWRVVDGEFRIGKGPNYESRVLARAFLPLKLNGDGGKFEMDISLTAEELNDTLRLYVLNPETGERVNYFAGSSLRPSRAKLTLPTGWQRADVVFEFESDENWNMEGPIIGNILVTR